MTAHTPGSRCRTTAGMRGQCLFAERHPGDHVFAELAPFCGVCGSDVGHADNCSAGYEEARSQCADLLAALDNLAKLFAALHPNHAEWGDYQAALAAIAKARGGQ